MKTWHENGKILWNLRNEYGGGASALGDLTDVDLTGFADADLLKYESETGLWVPSGQYTAPTPDFDQTNIVGHYVADDLTGVGSAQSAWNTNADTDGTLNLSASSGQEPVLRSGGPSSRQYVEFAAGHRMLGDPAFGGAEAEAFLVMRIPTLTSYYFLSFAASGGAYPSAGDNENWGGSAGVRLYGGAHLYENATSIRSWVFVRVRFTGGGTSLIKVGSSEVTGNAGSLTTGQFILGGHDASSGEWTAVDVAECIVYSPASDDPAGVETYLKGEYGL